MSIEPEFRLDSWRIEDYAGLPATFDALGLWPIHYEGKAFGASGQGLVDGTEIEVYPVDLYSYVIREGDIIITTSGERVELGKPDPRYVKFVGPSYDFRPRLRIRLGRAITRFFVQLAETAQVSRYFMR
jgi:hypothetical protein